ncbi:hypothetical protein EIN_052770 [Entamoeba invadens IP1]|uniref:hypothetical protein n=1 Tax=Entamoeba invadens IP1 TaxID=370355 RepID=UPI0002C3EB62|nr:hypothetical protein EIN_052770 [Entamoeba invadens IP1]ELP93062.1 hypothetical protein EIN_052770 [Entamoeba invadens IP1]|eukprot:XP_004259833.1 hypothetical protein EIN_052770 [Entamoeba invadens IP1]
MFKKYEPSGQHVFILVNSVSDIPMFQQNIVSLRWKYNKSEGTFKKVEVSKGCALFNESFTVPLLIEQKNQEYKDVKIQISLMSTTAKPTELRTLKTTLVKLLKKTTIPENYKESEFTLPFEELTGKITFSVSLKQSDSTDSVSVEQNLQESPKSDKISIEIAPSKHLSFNQYSGRKRRAASFCKKASPFDKETPVEVGSPLSIYGKDSTPSGMHSESLISTKCVETKNADILSLREPKRKHINVNFAQNAVTLSPRELNKMKMEEEIKTVDDKDKRIEFLEERVKFLERTNIELEHTQFIKASSFIMETFFSIRLTTENDVTVTAARICHVLTKDFLLDDKNNDFLSHIINAIYSLSISNKTSLEQCVYWIATVSSVIEHIRKFKGIIGLENKLIPYESSLVPQRALIAGWVVEMVCDTNKEYYKFFVDKETKYNFEKICLLVNNMRKFKMSDDFVMKMATFVIDISSKNLFNYIIQEQMEITRDLLATIWEKTELFTSLIAKEVVVTLEHMRSVKVLKDFDTVVTAATKPTKTLKADLEAIGVKAFNQTQLTTLLSRVKPPLSSAVLAEFVGGGPLSMTFDYASALMSGFF